jgi:hypothetical protein
MNDVPVLRIFRNHSRKDEQTITRLIQSLWWQLIKDQNVISDSLQTHYTKKQSLTNKKLWAAMLAEFDSVSTIPKAYVVVDGLNELDDQVMRWLVTSLIKLPANCHLLLTSRDLPVIRNLLTTPTICLKIKPHHMDLKALIYAQCHEPGSGINQVISTAGESNSGLYKEIEDTIVQKAGNM